MDLSFRMRTFNNMKHSQAIYLKLGYMFFTSLTKVVREAKVSICSAIKDLSFSAAQILNKIESLQIPTYLPTYLPTYIHTYIYTYIHV